MSIVGKNRVRPGIVAILFALVASACAAREAQPPAAAPVAPGDEAPGFRLPAAGGGEVSLDDYRGDRPVLLYFSMGPG